jgi:hypothetical protein
MCGGGGQSLGDVQVQQYLQQQQIQAQQQMAADSLAQQKSIADEQARQNQAGLDYTKQQDTLVQQQSQDQANRQAQWDQSRNDNAQSATAAVDKAFANFTPDYFKNYKDAYYSQADSELERQYGLARKSMAFGLARGGQLYGSNAADQAGQLAETLGRSQVDQANKAADAATQLQQQTAQSKNQLTQQALSSDTLGSPIAPGNAASLNSTIDQANRAVTNLGSMATNYASTIKPVDPSLGTLSGVFTGALTGVANSYQGAQDARIANAAYGGGGVSATGFGTGSVRAY